LGWRASISIISTIIIIVVVVSDWSSDYGSDESREGNALEDVAQRRHGGEVYMWLFRLYGRMADGTAAWLWLIRGDEAGSLKQMGELSNQLINLLADAKY
jgi:hypothetical protein